MKNLNQLRDEVYAINKANGWHEEERSFGELIALVHSEVSEALEDYRNGKAINEIWYEYEDDHGETLKINQSSIPQFDIGEDVVRTFDLLGKPCGIPSELADIVIRILDICGLYGWDVDYLHEVSVDEVVLKKENSLGYYLSLCHSSLGESFHQKYFGMSSDYTVSDYLVTVIQVVEYVCGENGINLEQTIQEKLAYNRTRGYKHGGKVI